MPLTLSRLVLASNNTGKIKEFQEISQTLSWTLHAQSEFDTPDIEETGLTFIENAILKARNAARYSGLPALADDSGLEVHALNGEPGIYSARFAGANTNDQKNNTLLLEKLKHVPDDARQASFRCCLALLRHEHDPCPVIAEGVWQGSIAHDEQGTQGFGYDPLFIVKGTNTRSAQLAPEQKNRISHRALAISELLKKIRAL